MKPSDDKPKDGDRVTGTTLDDPEHDRRPRRVTGRLTTRYVESLGYTQYLVGDEHVDPESVKLATD